MIPRWLAKDQGQQAGHATRRRSILRALEAVDAVFITHMETDGDDELVQEAYNRARRPVMIVDQLARAAWREVLAPGVN